MGFLIQNLLISLEAFNREPFGVHGIGLAFKDKCT